MTTLFYNDYGTFQVDKYKEADAIEIQGIAEYYPEKGEKFTIPDNDRPEYYSVFIHLPDGTTECLLDCSCYAKAKDYADDKARLRNLKVYDYVNQRIPDPFARNRNRDTGKNANYDKLFNEFVSWITSRKLPEMCVDELFADADFLLENDDLIFFENLLKRWQKVEIGEKIDLSQIETSEAAMYF